MSRRTHSDFGTLADRTSGAPDPTASTAVPGAGPERQVPPPSSRWVVIDGAEHGLIAKWRKDSTGQWEGLVARVGGIDDLYAEWIPAHRLTPPA